MAISDTGSNYQFFDKKIVHHPPRSKFDLTHLHSTTAFFGDLFPIYWSYTLPDSDYKLSIDSLVRCQSFEVPLMSRIRMFVHAYHVPLSVLWKGAQNFFNTSQNLTFGASVQSLFTKPTMPRYKASSQELVTNHSLANYLGLPIGFDLQDSDDCFISALPFFAYASIVKHYENNRWLQNASEQKKFYTQDEDAWRLPATGFSGTEFENPEFVGSKIQLNKLYNRYYANDYFQSARPSPMAGNPPSVDYDLNGPIDISGLRISTNGTPQPSGFDGYASLQSGSFSANQYSKTLLTQLSRDSTTGTFMVGQINDTDDNVYPYQIYNINQPAGQLQTLGLSGISLSLTYNMLRELDYATHELEIKNRLDGTYTEFIQAFFGDRPSHADKFKPIYIGGTYAPIVISEVLQTSATSAGSTPLGASAGHGISSNSGYIGRFHSDDFGILMLVASFVPDTMYKTGIDRKWSYSLQEEFPIDERVKLGPQAILNKEIFAFGANPNGLFAYQDRFDEWRYEQNVVTGYLADTSEVSYAPYTQVREFTTQPTFSDSTFRLSSQNVNRDFLTSHDDPPFICQFAVRESAILPLPYHAIPGGLS